MAVPDADRERPAIGGRADPVASDHRHVVVRRHVHVAVDRLDLEVREGEAFLRADPSIPYASGRLEHDGLVDPTSLGDCMEEGGVS